MNIVYFGTDVFLKLFRYLSQNHNIMALYTYYNQEDYFTEYNILREAEKLGIPVHYEAISREAIAEYISGGCELFFLAEYDRIIPCLGEDEGFRAINVHSSLLPCGRGYYPIENAMQNGVKKTGVTLHKAVSKFDNGDIIAQAQIDVTDEDDSVNIYIKSCDAALELLKEIMQDFTGSYNGAVKQNRVEKAEKRPDNERLKIHHKLTVSQAEEIYRRYNKLSYFTDGNREYRIVNMSCKRLNVDMDIFWISENYLHFKLKDGYARITAEQKKGRD